MDENVELLTDSELCEILRITPRTLKKYISEGEEGISGIKHCFVAGHRRWHKESVDEFIGK